MNPPPPLHKWIVFGRLTCYFIRGWSTITVVRPERVRLPSVLIWRSRTAAQRLARGRSLPILPVLLLDLF